MATPKRRHSNARTRKRRSHDALKTRSVSECSHCHSPIIPHRVCPSCGYYRGRQVITIKVKESKEKK